MSDIQDLNIKKEVLPIFDYSLNSFTRNKILNLLETSLISESQIIERQDILKSFITNIELFKKYSYTVLYLNEVHFFLNNFKIEPVERKYLLFFNPSTDEILLNNKIHQLILFFHRLESICFLRLNLIDFPETYRTDLKRILTFLSFFQLNKYEKIIKEKKWKNKDSKEIIAIILKLKSENRIETFWKDLFLFESYLSISRAIVDKNFVFPTFEKNSITLADFYHPIIKNPTKYSFTSSTNVIILNGPNMSGKSTFLKSVSLCVYLGNLGFGIPASTAKIPFCTDFSIGISKRDDILSGYSLFMTEIMSLKNILLKAVEGKRCFVVFDELFSGTNIEDALEICTTTINGVSFYSNSFFFISTHIQELKNLTSTNISTYYLDCEIINNTPTFTYKLKKGWSEIKVGRILFEKAGLNKLLNSKI
ncbi:hypothetical protein DOS84_16605 [Flavobacterium aquariorum]|uniref:DNA mismatch repair proteins mutS family domain-containing protein n=1 Tax=Flavobacterium aquariorum TaxID=2217670 RepID=A0A2W7TRA6_9FLAO|nr:hypothetical protein [Flavobacterium aquariorum]PZX92164.1 hypothetical protein DOS84_16605 [Flavobacterium aquariorum]